MARSKRPHLLLVVLLAAVGSKRAFVPVPMPPRRHIPTVTLPVLGLSTQGALAVEAAKQADPTFMELGQIPVTTALPFIVNVIGFTVAALCMSVKDDLKGVKEDVKGVKEDVKELKKDFKETINGVTFLVALCTGVFGYAACKP